MKKLIAFILSIMMLFPAAVFADESQYIGTWIDTGYNTDGTLRFTIIDIQPDYTAVTAFGRADGDDHRIAGRSFIGTWNLTAKGIHVVCGHNATKDLTLYGNDLLVEKGYGLYTIYNRITQHTDESASAIANNIVDLPAVPETGLRVPQGTYTIGADIPAGTYRVEIASGTGYYDVYEKEKGSIIIGGVTGELYDVTEIGKITLNNGNILKLVNSTFILYPYKGLFN